MDPVIQQAARAIVNARHVVALTGAGISVESGIPPFRGKGGLWETVDPMEVAHIDAFLSDPARVWRLLINALGRLLLSARPNEAHHSLAALGQMGRLASIVTQNVDGLHQAAGSRRVVEFHGTFATVSCLQCGTRRPLAKALGATLPPRCECGGILRPDCVFFGEMIPTAALQAAQTAVARCDLMLVVGTSATVQPAAQMPLTARQNGALVIEINPSKTPLSRSLSDHVIRGKAGESLRHVTAAVKAMAARAS